MKNKSLLSLLVFSSLIIPTMVNAGLVNERVKLQGNLSIQGSETITLGWKYGDSISLNKGIVDVQMETLENPISMLMPRLYIEQNGEMLAIKVPPSKYLNADEFELTADFSGLNYDLLMEKKSSKGNEVKKIEEEGCTYKIPGDRRVRLGVVKVQNTYITTKETYKLTMSKDGIVAAKFISNKLTSDKVNSTQLDICK